MADGNARTVSKIGVIGAGAMGRGIAQVAAQGGMDVVLIDTKPGVADEAKAFIDTMFGRLVEKDKMTAAEKAEAVGRIQARAEIAGLEDADLVIEAVVEKLEVKQSVFATLEAMVRSDCILASNTSSLSIAAIAAKAQDASRVAGFHFFNPVPLMRLVEVIDGIRTAPWVAATLMEVGKRMGRVPVHVKDAPGFLVNQIGRGYTIESAHLLDEGIASPADIDRIMRDLVGFRMGPFELMDLTGLDVTHPATVLIFEQMMYEPRFRPSLAMDQRTLAGILGRKTKTGFYSYEDGKQVAIPEAAIAGEMPSSIWVSATNEAGRAAILDAVQGAGVTVEQGAQPSEDALCLVAPIGIDATTAVLQEGLDPARTVAVETLFAMDKRRVVMPCAGTDPARLAAAAALLSAGGVPVTVIRESAGFVAQRVVAMIVNICAAIAQNGAAKPEDIDKAPTLALNYPLGPFTLADRIGGANVLRILEGMHAVLGDPRYRPNPWLARRARLGLSLSSPEPMAA